MPQYPPYGQQQDVATTSSGLGAGAGDHLPVGDYSTMDYRSAMRFAVPSGWTGWTAITSATLKFYISDHQHVAPKNSSIFCSRMNVPVWTKDQGTQDCESGFSGSNNTQYGDIGSVSTDRISFSSGSTANAAKTLDVTAMVRYYWANNSPLVFVFDNNGSDQYTEIWSLGKTGTTYDAVLTINYETNTAPNAPTLTGPGNGSTVTSQTPTFSWTHSDPQGDAQSNAEVRVYDAAGTTLLYQWQTGTAQSLVSPVALTQGVTYRWAVMTNDGVLWGGLSTQQSFTIQKNNPVVTIKVPRKMTFLGNAPRLIVEWSSDQPQGQFLVTAPGYTSGTKSGGDQSWVLDTLALTNGTPVTVTVQVWNTDGTPLTGSSSRAFTPRWGLTTHKRTLAATPINWQQPSVVSTVPKDATNGDCQLIIEYGSAAAAADAAPTGWFTSFSSVPKTPYLHWRAWFIPNHVTGPTLDTISIGYDTTVAVLDKWGTNPVWPWEANGGIPARFSIDTGEAVYGTRSLRLDPDGAARYIHSTKLKVREGRSYVLSGLMRSQGNSGAYFRLQNYTTVFATSQDRKNPLVLPVWPAGVLTDWERYKSAVWKAPTDMEVFVTCITDGGVAGSTAWFDGLKLEESIVATPWNPASVGATTLDAGGVQIDGTKGGAFRYRGTVDPVTYPRAVVEGGTKGLNFGDSTAQLWSDAQYGLNTNANFNAAGSVEATGGLKSPVWSMAPYHLAGGTGAALRLSGDGTSYGKWALIAHGTLSSQYWSNAVRGIIQSRYGAWEVAMHIGADAGMGAVETPVVVTTRMVADGLQRNLNAKITIASRNPLIWYLFVQMLGNYEYVDWFPQDTTGEGTLPVIDNPATTGWVADTGASGYGTVEYLSTNYSEAVQNLIVPGRMHFGGNSFPANPSTNDLYFHTSPMMWYYWNGSGWIAIDSLTPSPQLVQGGALAVVIAAGAFQGSATITYPRAFTGPYAFVSLAVEGASGAMVPALTGPRTASQQGVYIRHRSDSVSPGTYYVNWVAVGNR